MIWDCGDLCRHFRRGFWASIGGFSVVGAEVGRRRVGKEVTGVGSERPGEGVGSGSRRRTGSAFVPGEVEFFAGGSGVEFVGDADEGIEDLSHLRFEISVVEALYQHEGDQEGQDEVDDGGGIVFEAVVHGPVAAEGIEVAVFDIPSVMACFREDRRGAAFCGERGRPIPGRRFGVADPRSGDPFALRSGFLGVQHAEGYGDVLGRREAVGVPVADRAFVFVFDVTVKLIEDGPGVFQQKGVVAFQHRHDVLTAGQAELEERSFHIDRVPHNGVEESAIVLKHTIQKTFGRNHLPLTGTQHLHVQRQGQVEPDQMANHPAMIVFRNVLVIDLDRPSTARLTMTTT